MSNNLLLAGLIGAAVFLVVRKQAKAATVQQPGAPVSFTAQQPRNTNMPTANVNSDMWTRLLGAKWTDLAAGSAFIGRNIFGQATSSDGKPISSTDFYYQLQAGDVVDLPENVIGGGSLPSGVDTLFDWGATSGDDGLSWDDIRGLV
ncbi:hypothetical protein GTP45_10645 [Pseudoduganella sp. FT55W]|uniref:Uncharacterized protein n=1 Tax=Duganella rivi TaxID=2666083 RepID=A0A7X4GPK3_9BURK|nr:hypothetical protein [Duganella rivi]MYM67288.1 hypothetical protein [Duganella rivi]